MAPEPSEPNQIDALINRPAKNSGRPPAHEKSGDNQSQLPSRPSGQGGNGEIRFTPESIKRFGDAYESICGDLLKEARRILNGTPREAHSAAFTMYGFELATAHIVAIEWADEDLKSKAKKLAEFKEKAHITAQCQRDAEDANTLKQ